MSQKVYVITGAKSGIGLEITKRLINKKHTVFAGVRLSGSAPAHDLEKLAESSHGLLTVMDLDVALPASIEKFKAALKTAHVDTLINNAGVYSKEDGPIAKVSPDQVQWTFNTNFFGPFCMTQAMLPLLKKAKSPVVANISSKMGSITDNTSGSSFAYRASKAALNMFTKNLSVDEPTVTAITLHPGWVKTRMGGEQAPLSPEHSADGLVKVIEHATQKQSGHFLNYDGSEIAW